MGAVAVFALGRVQLAASQAQTAADLAAISAARDLRGHLGDVALDGPGAEAAWRARLAEAARAAAAPAGARVEAIGFPEGAWPPTAVEVTVSVAGPGGQRVRAIARAGLTIAAQLGAEGRTGLRERRRLLGAAGVSRRQAHVPGGGGRVRPDGRRRAVGGDRPGGDQRVPQRRRAGGALRPPPGPALGGAAGAEPSPRRHRARPEHGRRRGGPRLAGRARRGLRLPPALRLGAVALGLPARVRRGDRDGRRRRRRAAGRGDAARLGAGALPRARHLRGPRRGPAADPPRRAPPIGVGLRPPRREPGRGAGDRPVHARHRARAGPARPVRSRGRRSRPRRGCWPATCARSARCRWRWPRTTPDPGPSSGTGECRPSGRPRPTWRASWPWPEERRRSREAPPATASPSCAPAIDSSDPRGYAGVP